LQIADLSYFSSQMQLIAIDGAVRTTTSFVKNDNTLYLSIYKKRIFYHACTAMQSPTHKPFGVFFQRKERKIK
jgi:hypothetical protein